MHQTNTVVTLYALKGNRKTPLREYDHSRIGLESSARATLPFGSEYGIGFKFQDPGRRRLELWIDGAMVTDQVVIESDTFLERFLDSDRRFKFVEANHQDVADPTSPSNGGIVIKLWKEAPRRRPVLVRQEPSWLHRQTPDVRIGGGGSRLGSFGYVPPGVYTKGIGAPGNPGSDGARGISGQSIQCSTAGGQANASVTRGCGFGDSIAPLLDSCSVDPDTSVVCNYDLNWNDIGSVRPEVSKVGATVEGSQSNQTFTSTEWGGDLGAPLVFKFKLFGQAAEPIVNHCPGCGRQMKRKETANFCTHCGADLR